MDEENKLDNVESKKAQDTSLRREARRRNILENAKSRLERLNGRIGGGGDTINEIKQVDEQTYEFSDPEVEPDIRPDRVRCLQTLNNLNAEYSAIFTSLGIDSNLNKKKSYVLASRIHIVISTLIAYALAMGGSDVLEGYGISVSVFFPFSLAVALELMFFREQHRVHPITNLLITICGFRTQEASRFLRFFSTIQSLIIDVGIFVFLFCILAVAFTHINNRYVDLIVIK